MGRHHLHPITAGRAAPSGCRLLTSSAVASASTPPSAPVHRAGKVRRRAAEVCRRAAEVRRCAAEDHVFQPLAFFLLDPAWLRSPETEAVGGLNPLVGAEHDVLFTGRVTSEEDAAEGREPPPRAATVVWSCIRLGDFFATILV
jgi:hypothetical protein